MVFHSFLRGPGKSIEACLCLIDASFDGFQAFDVKGDRESEHRFDYGEYFRKKQAEWKTPKQPFLSLFRVALKLNPINLLYI